MMEVKITIFVIEIKVSQTFGFNAVINEKKQSIEFP